MKCSLPLLLATSTLVMPVRGRDQDVLATPMSSFEGPSEFEHMSVVASEKPSIEMDESSLSSFGTFIPAPPPPEGMPTGVPPPPPIHGSPPPGSLGKGNKPKARYSDMRPIGVPRPEAVIRPGKLALGDVPIDGSIEQEYLKEYCVSRSLMSTRVIKDTQTGRKVPVSFLAPERQRSLTLALTKIMNTTGLKTLGELIAAIDEHDKCLLMAPPDLLTALIPPRDPNGETITDFDLFDAWAQENSVKDEEGQVSLRPGLFELLPLGDQYIALLRERGLSRRWRVRMLGRTLQLPSILEHLELKLSPMISFVSILHRLPELDTILSSATALVNFINRDVTGHPPIKGITIVGLNDLCGLKDVSGTQRLMDLVVKMVQAQGISPKRLADQLRTSKMAEASRVCLPLITKELEQQVNWFNSLNDRYGKAMEKYGDEPGFAIFVKHNQEFVEQQKERLQSLIEKQQGVTTMLKEIVDRYGKQSIMYIPESAIGIPETQLVDNIKTISQPEHWHDANLTANLVAIALKNILDCMIKAEERIQKAEALKLRKERQPQPSKIRVQRQGSAKTAYGESGFPERHFGELRNFDQSKLRKIG